MARYCLDASVVLTWLLGQGTGRTDDFWSTVTTGDDLLGASLLWPETTSVLRQAVFDGRLLHADSMALVESFLDMPIRPVDDRRQFARALDLAQRFQHKKAYDMQYLAVAQLEDAELVTRDRGLRHAANEIGVGVRLLS